MKKTIFLLPTIILGALLAAQIPQDLAGKVVGAIGGPEAVRKWSVYEAEGDMVYSASGMEITGKIRLVRSGVKSWNRTELKFGGTSYVMLMGFDGKVAWAERMGQVSDQPTLNEETRTQHDVDLFLKSDVTWSLGKESELEGKKVISLEADRKGKKTVFWIDPASFLIQEISFRDLMISDKEIKEEQEQRIRYSDYQKVDGVMFPMKVVTTIKSRKGGELRFAKVTFNPKVSPVLFERPQKKLDLRYSEEIID